MSGGSHESQQTQLPSRGPHRRRSSPPNGRTARSTTADRASPLQTGPTSSSASGGAARMIGAALSSSLKTTRITPKWSKAHLPCDAKFVWSGSHRSDTAQLDYSPATLFELFISDDILKYIAKSSVEYARQKGNHAFELVSDDVRAFIAILFTSGYTVLPARRMYWECSPDVHNDAISSTMTRNRFEEILRYFHLADNNNLDPSDKFSKVRPLVNQLNDSFLKHFPVSQQLSIDESMIPYFGHHSAKQFIRGKPIRFGYKVWCLTTPLGYLIQLDPYQGASKGSYGDVGLGGSVVLKLISRLPEGLPFHIYFDNLFTSISLLGKLSELGIGGSGTIRNNRLMGCPLADLSKASRGAYDYAYDSVSYAVLVRWMDSKPVTLASNCNGVNPVMKARRWSNASKAKIEIDQPFVISQYNKFMGGVDRLDQNIAQYRIGIRSRKWYWPIIAYLLQTAMHNAWLLYRESRAATTLPLSHLQFIREVCKVYYAKSKGNAALLSMPVRNPKTLERRCPGDIRFDGVGHYIERNPTQVRCAVCNMKVYKKCAKCGVGLHLDCFPGFHTRP